MKQDLIYTHTYKQTLHMTTGLKSHLEILSKDRQTLSDLLYNVSQNNPFLEYTPSQDIQQYLEAGISNKPSLKDELYLQLHTSTKKYNEPIAHYIIESLDSHGFFDQDIQTVLSDLKCTKAQFEETLSFIQTFEPIGVAAKNSIDSLMIQLKEKGYTYEQDGALWFRTTDFGDDKDRVLIKTDGSYTYFTPDIAYHLSKMNRGYDYLVDLLGADHHGYINRMKAAIQALGYNADQLNIDILQMVRMVENGEVVKMSKRTGNAVTIRDLIDDIGVDATRYFFVAKAANTPFDFDLGLAKSQSNENPVYYAQYAHARMCSIMRSAAEKNIEPADHFELINNPKEIELLKHINEFKNTINDAARTRAPHKIANYIQKLAQLFHSFYGDCHVIDEENKELSSQRLALVEATRITLANALNLIGVHAPEKM